jgi:redox-sensitive bicupin YhaK (pirin superfamily)
LHAIAPGLLQEPVAWRGPIVMNTNEESQQAFSELRTGTFMQDR